MNRIRTSAVAFAALLASLAAGAAAPDTPGADEHFPPGEIVPKIVCRSDPRYSFALYLPKTFDPARQWPLLLLFDARGHGALAAERFRAGAERFGWVIASSNDTRSDDASAPNAAAIQAVWNDAQHRFPIDVRRIVTAGFSGGARLAFAVAMSRAALAGGVIAASGGLPSAEPAGGDPEFPVFGTAGMRDFNYREMRALDRSLGSAKAAHRLEIFDGGHEWPPAETATRAVAWLEVQAMRRGSRAPDRALATELFAESLAHARQREAAGDTEGAYEEAEAAARDFDGLASTQSALEIVARLRPQAVPRIEEARRRDAREEGAARHMREELDRILAVADPAAFATAAKRLEIARWRERAASGPEAERLSASRVIETLFTQTAFYAPRDFFAKNEARRAALSLEIATALKPESAGAWYDLACARARYGESRRALEALRTAIDRGFREAELLAKDPDLDSLRGLDEFREIARRLSPKP